MLQDAPQLRDLASLFHRRLQNLPGCAVAEDRLWLLVKAYNRVTWAAIWRAMRRRGVLLSVAAALMRDLILTSMIFAVSGVGTFGGGAGFTPG